MSTMLNGFKTKRNLDSVNTNLRTRSTNITVLEIPSHASHTSFYDVPITNIGWGTVRLACCGVRGISSLFYGTYSMQRLEFVHCYWQHSIHDQRCQNGQQQHNKVSLQWKGYVQFIGTLCDWFSERFKFWESMYLEIIAQERISDNEIFIAKYINFLSIDCQCQKQR